MRIGVQNENVSTPSSPNPKNGSRPAKNTCECAFESLRHPECIFGTFEALRGVYKGS